MITLAALYATVTVQRVWQWRAIDSVLASEGPALPEISRRLQVDRAIRGFETGAAGRTDQALAVLASGNLGDRAAAAQWRVIFACDEDNAVSNALLQALQQAAPPRITHNHASYMDLLVRRVERGVCLEAEHLLPVLAHWAGASVPPSHGYGPRQLTIQQARLHMLIGAPEAAWLLLTDDRRDDFESQTLYIRVLIELGRQAEARDLIRRAQGADRGWYRGRTQVLAQLAAQAG